MDRGTLVIELGSRPYEPYPPDDGGGGAVARRDGRGRKVGERGGKVVVRGDGEEVVRDEKVVRREEGEKDLEGQPVPLHIKNTEAGKCLDALESLWEGRGERLRETEMQIIDNKTGRVVAKGELKYQDEA